MEVPIDIKQHQAANSLALACLVSLFRRMITHVPGDAHSFEINWALSDRWLEKIMTTSNTSKARKETVVVNDVERFFPALCDWSFETFDWIPNWRKDDCQISLAEKGGGIGAHVDNYDVFLIQMQGRRTWQVGNKIMSWAEEDRRTIRDLDVRILDNWDGQEMTELVLKPGDVLYLPPRVAHCGIALTDDCMTLSVGQRAPSVSDMVSRLAEELSTSSEDAATRRYTDKHLLDHGASSDLTPGKLTVDSLERARRLLLNELASMLNDDDWFGDFYGRFVSEQKRLRDHYPFPLEGDEEGDSKFIVRQVFEVGQGALYQAEGITFIYSQDRLYVNGQRFETATAAAATTAAALCNNRRIDRKLLLIDGSSRLSSDALALLEELVALGLLYFSEEE